MAANRVNDAAATKIPSLNVNTALSICDGTVLVGFVVEHDGSWFSYGRDHVLIGEYRSQHQAVVAIPKVE